MPDDSNVVKDVYLTVMGDGDWESVLSNLRVFCDKQVGVLIFWSFSISCRFSK